MSTLRLLIQRPGKGNTFLPVIVDRASLIGNGIAALVDYLGCPRHDALGRTFTYALRPLSGGPPLPNTLRFVDVPLLPETRLVLEVQERYVATQPIACAPSVAPEEPPLNLSRQPIKRRTFVVGSVLTGCAASGLFAGIATAFATSSPRPLPAAMARPATSTPLTPPPALQQALLFSGHQQTVRAVGWSPDGTALASGADDGLLFVWTPRGQIQQRIAHPAGVATLAWSPDGHELASGSGTDVRFFDAHTVAQLAPVRHAHSGQITSLAWSNITGHPLISGALDQRAVVWGTHDFAPQAVFARHTEPIEALASQPIGQAVASVSQGGAVRVWNVETRTELHPFYLDASLPMRAVAFAPTGNLLAVGGNDGQVRLWDNGLTCQQPATTSLGLVCADVPLRFRAHSAPVRSLAWSPDGRFLATGGEDRTLAIWIVRPGQPTLLTRTTSAAAVDAVAWSPAGKQVAATAGTTVTVWDVQG